MSVKAKNVIVAMSGGVDSSVAAALLLRQGYNVTGVSMRIWDGRHLGGSGNKGCYGPGAEKNIEDARMIAYKLGIDFFVVDASREFREEVLDYFCREYLDGRTPNPCVRCNARIKFGTLWDKAGKPGIGFDYFATGHYARIERDTASGRCLLKKGIDTRKDQSYFLYNLSQQQLAHTLFPLGGMMKSDVKNLCAEMGLDVESRKESQDFIHGGYAALFENQPGPGPLLDCRGRVLGKHSGIVHYTVGQRKGLGIAAAEPLFVIDIDPESNAVVVGGKEELYKTGQIVSSVNWIAVPSIYREMHVKARIRSLHAGYPAVISPPDGGTVKVTYKEPQIAAARGQSIVFYDDDVVIGGGVVI